MQTHSMEVHDQDIVLAVSLSFSLHLAPLCRNYVNFPEGEGCIVQTYSPQVQQTLCKKNEQMSTRAIRL